MSDNYSGYTKTIPLEDYQQIMAAIREVMRCCRFEEDRIELTVGNIRFVARPSRHAEYPQEPFLMALWRLHKAVGRKG